MSIKFKPGQCVQTIGISSQFDDNATRPLMMRHLAGDFGDVSEDSKEQNAQAIKDEDGMIMSVYKAIATKKGDLQDIWIISYVAQNTTVLLPEEY